MELHFPSNRTLKELKLSSALAELLPYASNRTLKELKSKYLPLISLHYILLIAP